MRMSQFSSCEGMPLLAASMDWELSKENVQPLRKGRKVDVLNEVLKTKVEGPTRTNIFEDQRRKMIEAIDSYEGDDPLDPWLQCIKWVKDAYPTGGAQSELLPLLEACTRTFQIDERYKSDLRYLRVWVQYADCCTEPRDIFPFLEANSIGQDHALFYEAYATYMEVCRNYNKATEIYELGIQRGAQPSLRLENMYQSFLKRMMKRNERKLQEEQDAFEPEKLRTFGESRTAHTGIAARNPSSVQEQRRRVRPPQTQGPGIAVYVDTEFQGGHPSTLPPQSASSHLPYVSGWKNLATQAETRKENSQLPAKWTETKVPRMGKASKPVASQPVINVYVDEEFEDAEAEVSAKNDRTVPASLRLRLDGVPDHRRFQEALKKNPLLHFADGERPSLTSLLSRKPAESRAEEAVCDTAATVSSSAGPVLIGSQILNFREDGCEHSFEEARLLKGKQSSQWTSACSPKDSVEKAKMIEKSLNMFQLEHARRKSEEHSPLTRVTERQPPVHGRPVPKSSMHNTGTEISSTRQLLSRGNSSVSSFDEGFACSMPRQDSRSSFTTASSIDSLGEPPAFACTMPRTASTLPSVMSITGEETVAIKKYAEQLITLGADANAESMDALSHHGLLDQTINTKEALSDILSMFNRPLSCEKPRAKPRTHRTQPPTTAPNVGFQVFVDDDLDVQPRDQRVDNHEGKSKSLEIYEDEEVFVPRRSAKGPTSAPAKATFEVFVDEDMGAQRGGDRAMTNQGRPRNTFNIFEDEVLPVPRKTTKGGFQVFVNEDLDAPSIKSQVSNSRGKESVEIFEDEVMPPPRNVDKGVPKSRTMSKPQDTGFAIFVDDDLANQPARRPPSKLTR